MQIVMLLVWLRSLYSLIIETKNKAKGKRINTFFEDLVKSSLIYSAIQSETNNIAERTRSNLIDI